MEGLDQCHDGVPSLAVFIEGIFSRELDGTLIRLRTGVCKEDFSHPCGCHELLCGAHHGLRVIEVGSVHELFRLFCHGIYDRRISVA